MNRKAFLLYLRNIRDLEIAKRKLNSIRYSCNDYYRNKKNNIDRLDLTTEYWMYTREDAESALIKGGVLSGLGVGLFLFAIYKIKKGEDFFPYIWIFSLESVYWLVDGLSLFGGVFFLGLAVFKYMKAAYEKRKINKKNRQLQAQYDSTRNESTRISQQWNEQINYYDNELKKVHRLLQQAYEINIIPNQYRNLQSIYYIYDYMSSSKASFEDTLIHEHMENGIQRILEKLDRIIAQNEYIIYQNRILEASNQNIISQNNAMLQSLKNAERNTETAAYYSELASNYNGVNAFFSMANYLQSKNK